LQHTPRFAFLPGAVIVPLEGSRGATPRARASGFVRAVMKHWAPSTPAGAEWGARIGSPSAIVEITGEARAGLSSASIQGRIALGPREGAG